MTTDSELRLLPNDTTHSTNSAGCLNLTIVLGRRPSRSERQHPGSDDGVCWQLVGIRPAGRSDVVLSSRIYQFGRARRNFLTGSTDSSALRGRHSAGRRAYRIRAVTALPRFG